MIKVLRAKLHGIRVTSADLDYHGSITLDPEHCEAAGIYPLEFVDIWNKNSGARISTYVVFGDRGSRCCILNGAAHPRLMLAKIHKRVADGSSSCRRGERCFSVALPTPPSGQAHLTVNAADPMDNQNDPWRHCRGHCRRERSQSAASWRRPARRRFPALPCW